MSATRRASTPLKLHLLPELALYFPARAKALGQKPSGLLSILVWNDHLRPNLYLKALPPSAKLARVPVGCTLRAQQRKFAVARARAQKLSFNAYIEALIHGDHSKRFADFVVISSS